MLLYLVISKVMNHGKDLPEHGIHNVLLHDSNASTFHTNGSNAEHFFFHFNVARYNTDIAFATGFVVEFIAAKTLKN